MENNSCVLAKNTLLLYFRQILIMAVSLYTARVVLAVLGAEDFGIYNVVAGVVTMFGFLGGAMTSSSQRYFSYDLGKKDLKHLEITFSVTFQIYLLIALVVFLFVETAGLWFLNTKLVIPSNRLIAANWIFQAAIISFLLTLITTPFMAIIIAHENMTVYAYVSIVEVALKLGIVFLLEYLPYDKLIVYGILLSLVSFINTAIYRFYCHKHYSECKVRFICDGKLFKEIIAYSGWNLFGNLAAIFKNQGINILLNLHFGAIVNAARGIAGQVNSAVMSFSNNFSTALRPQVIKTYKKFSSVVRKYGVTHIWTRVVRLAKRFVIYALRLAIYKWGGVIHNGYVYHLRPYYTLLIKKSNKRYIFLNKNSACRKVGGVLLFNTRNLRIS